MSFSLFRTEESPASTVLTATLLLLLFVLLVSLFRGAESNDLLAVWLAGVHYDANQVYAGSNGIFTMTPPQAWHESVSEPRSVFPYIYPPIWAALMSHVVDLTSFERFAQIAGVVHAALIVGMFFLAWRIVGKPSAGTFFLIASLIAILSSAFILARMENQPQIVVSFLILLAIERERAGKPIVGGITLALAAGIKVYPLFFAVFWLAAGRRTAVASFAASGTALGLLSIWLAGWPMHLAYLNELSAISNTVLLSLANFSVDPFLASLFLDTSAITTIDTSATGGEAVWQIQQKSDFWRLINLALLVLTVCGLSYLAYRKGFDDPIFWPLALVAISWTSPLAWNYHYMTALAFLPAFPARFGMVRGLAAVAAIILPTTYPMIGLLRMNFETGQMVVISINVALITMITICAATFQTRRRNCPV